MLIRLFYISIFLYCFEAHSQTKEEESYKKNHLHLKIGGHGGYGSINYERVIFLKNNSNLNGEVGVSTFHLNDYTNTFNPDLILPFSINFCYGKKHAIETSLGQSISSVIITDQKKFTPKRSTNLNTNFAVGYRYNKKDKLIIRVAYSPILDSNNVFIHWAYISFGTSF